MPAYMVAEVNTHDDAWVADYRRDVPPMIARAGGRYLARTGKIELLEGEPGLPQVIALFEFETMAGLKAFMTSEEYRPYSEARQKGATCRIYAFE